MRRLLDIDVLLDVAFQRPGEPVSTRLIGLYGTAHEAWVAWHTLATLAYLIERQLDAAEARSFVEGLLGWADVAPTARADAVQAVALRTPTSRTRCRPQRRSPAARRRSSPATCATSRARPCPR